jgi:hypothetical protein
MPWHGSDGRVLHDGNCEAKAQAAATGACRSQSRTTSPILCNYGLPVASHKPLPAPGREGLRPLRVSPKGSIQAVPFDLAVQEMSCTSAR